MVLLGATLAGVHQRVEAITLVVQEAARAAECAWQRSDRADKNLERIVDYLNNAESALGTASGLVRAASHHTWDTDAVAEDKMATFRSQIRQARRSIVKKPAEDKTHD